MKVIQSIEAAYEEQKDLNLKLKARIDEILNRIKETSWHYFSRIKQLESFALKLETGRFSDPKHLDDFFACTLVVENLDQINKAQALLRQNFNVLSQKPKSARLTHKEPSSFQFDDLRLYAKLKQVDYLPIEPLSSILFEIQIKTFLQHAWGLATHNLIYKADEINWPKERIAYQIKAMLEQAEVTISGVNNLVNLPEVFKDNYETTQQKKILKFYLDFFSREDLPQDIVRLCKNTNELLHALDLSINELKRIINIENKQGRGTSFKNLSPYLLIVQSIINQKPQALQNYIDKQNGVRFKILLPKEINLNKIILKTKEKIVIV